MFVLKVTEDNKAQKIEVKKGRDVKDKVEIFGALTENTVLILKASEEIKEGSPVKVK